MARNNTPEGSTAGTGACTAKATVYNGAAPGANTNIVTAFGVSESASALRVTVCLSTSSVFNVVVTDGTNPHTQSLNGGTALAANALYTFTFGVRKYSTQTGETALTYSFQVATDSVIETLFVEEITGPVF